MPTLPLRLLAAPLLALLLGACAMTPQIPETTWHRLPPAAVQVPSIPATALPIVVQRFEADGLHADQSLLYALDADGVRLRSYHYNRWVDPPGALLQRRLAGMLRAAGASGQVIEQLQGRVTALWISGRIETFERVPVAGGWEARVALRLRVEQRGASLPLLEREYAARVAAADNSIAASVVALGSGVDEAFAAFLAELGPLLREVHP
ncbi:MAG: PqiC family protein [Aquimonas sp.]|nr:PqiC family protein [Aquimonas sp.]